MGLPYSNFNRVNTISPPSSVTSISMLIHGASALILYPLNHRIRPRNLYSSRPTKLELDDEFLMYLVSRHRPPTTDHRHMTSSMRERALTYIFDSSNPRPEGRNDFAVTLLGKFSSLHLAFGCPLVNFERAEPLQLRLAARMLVVVGG